MKKIISLSFVLLLLALFANYNGISQTTNTDNQSQFSNILATGYTFSHSTGTYADLVGSTNLSAGQIWDIPYYSCPIGFTFKFFNVPFTEAWVSDPYNVDFGSSVGTYFVTPFGADLVDRAFGDGTVVPKSPISYLLDGTEPNRILKIEWKNAAFLGEIIGYATRTNYINLQLWLYETSNNIEIHYGPQNVTYTDSIYVSTTGPIVSLSNNVGSKYMSLVGAAANPTVSNLPEQNMTGTPPAGKIYKFATDYVSISDKTEAKCTFYPNPVKDMLNVVLPEKSVWTNIQVFNLLGNEILHNSFLNCSQFRLDLSSLPAGSYLLKLQTPEMVFSKIINKQ